MRVFSAILILVLVLPRISTAQDWSTDVVATGTKPSLALDSEGNPHIGYIYEVATGWVRYAQWNTVTEQFDTMTAASGNFYGPPSIAIDQNDLPGLNFHRHSPVPEQMYAHYDGSTWSLEAIVSDNHDGWDNSLRYDSNNLPRTSSIDPSNFGATSTGIEYALFDGVSWQVEAIGSAKINYFTGTSLELDGSDNPHIAYYDDITADLTYATNPGDGWSISTVESAGDVGRFPSLELDGSGNPHISYYEHLIDSTGLVKYASWNGASWDITVVDTLHRVYLEFARTLTSLDLDGNDIPHLSYNDEAVVKYATWNGSSWETETIVDVNNESTIIGQANSIGVAADGTVHVAYYELLTRSPLTGIVMHARKDPASTTSVTCEDITIYGARCNSSGAVQSIVKILNGDFSGDVLTWLVDGEPVEVTVISDGSRSVARMAVPHAGIGQHTVELIDPAGCYPEDVVTCQVDAPSDPQWEALLNAYEEISQRATGRGALVETNVIGNYPNPFNPSTTIRYSIAEEGHVTLRIYNTLGEEVATLVNEVHSPGVRSAFWNGRTDAGVAVASGIYLYRLAAGGLTLTGRMLFVK